jgi:hypothetical protein
MSLAIQMCKKWPILSLLVDFDMKNQYYINESTTNFASKFFKPLPQNDVFEQDINWKFDADPRHVVGSEVFNAIYEEQKAKLADIKEKAENDFAYVFDEDYK